MDELRATPNDLYQYLCKLFGSPEVVRLRRTLYTAAEALYNDDGFQTIPSGSRCEGLEMRGSDFDIMDLDKSVTVYENWSEDFLANDTVTVLMDNSETNLGFTRLILPYMYNNNISERVINKYKNLLTMSFDFNGKHYISSLLFRDSYYVDGLNPHGPCQMINETNYDTEFLTCLRCREWISLVCPWKTRIRRSWPSQQLIDDITQYGVLFVPVGSRTSEHEQIEWRISFSIAEKQLIHSFSHTQLLCYAMLKVVISDIIKKQHGELLCSYFVKTIMFWMSEENDSKYWFPANIVKCFLSCLQRLIYCVQYRDCRHYFIPEINFFEDRFNDTDQRSMLSSLYQVYNTGWTALLYTTTFQSFNSISLQHPDYTSSVIAPCGWITISGHNIDLSHILRSIIGFSNITSNFTKQGLLYVTAKIYQLTIWDYNVYFQGNKILYKQYRDLLPELLIGTKTDCVSGWCYLASLFYKMKLYKKCNYIVDYCLSKCTHDKIDLGWGPHIKIPVPIQHSLCNSRWFPAVLRHCVINCVKLSQYLLPEELTFLYDEDMKYVVIPPVVYLFFLKFICAHHLKLDRDKELAFRGLQRTAMDTPFIVNDHQLLITGQIVDVAHRLLYET